MNRFVSLNSVDRLVDHSNDEQVTAVKTLAQHSLDARPQRLARRGTSPAYVVQEASSSPCSAIMSARKPQKQSPSTKRRLHEQPKPQPCYSDLDTEIRALLGDAPVDRFGPFAPLAAIRSSQCVVPAHHAPAWKQIIGRVAAAAAAAATAPRDEEEDVAAAERIFRAAESCHFDVQATLQCLEQQHQNDPSQTPQSRRTIDTRLTPRLVSDLRWNAVVPIPMDKLIDEDGCFAADDLIYLCPSRYRGRLPLHLLEYAAHCLLQRQRQTYQGGVTILVNLRDFKIVPKYFEIEDWKDLVMVQKLPSQQQQEEPLQHHPLVPVLHSAVKQILFVNPTPDFETHVAPYIIAGKEMAPSSSSSSTMPLIRICQKPSQMSSYLPEGYETYLPSSDFVTSATTSAQTSDPAVPQNATIYRFVEDFIHYRQTLEGLLERRRRQFVNDKKSSNEMMTVMLMDMIESQKAEEAPSTTSRMESTGPTNCYVWNQNDSEQQELVTATPKTSNHAKPSRLSSQTSRMLQKHASVPRLALSSSKSRLQPEPTQTKQPAPTSQRVRDSPLHRNASVKSLPNNNNNNNNTVATSCQLLSKDHRTQSVRSLPTKAFSSSAAGPDATTRRSQYEMSPISRQATVRREGSRRRLVNN